MFFYNLSNNISVHWICFFVVSLIIHSYMYVCSDLHFINQFYSITSEICAFWQKSAICGFRERERERIHEHYTNYNYWVWLSLPYIIMQIQFNSHNIIFFENTVTSHFLSQFSRLPQWTVFQKSSLIMDTTREAHSLEDTSEPLRPSTCLYILPPLLSSCGFLDNDIHIVIGTIVQ